MFVFVFEIFEIELKLHKILEPNLYNPALFANINPLSWEMGSEYLEFVDKHPCSFACIRGHLFKIFFKV